MRLDASRGGAASTAITPATTSSRCTGCTGMPPRSGNSSSGADASVQEQLRARPVRREHQRGLHDGAGQRQARAAPRRRRACCGDSGVAAFASAPSAETCTTQRTPAARAGAEQFGRARGRAGPRTSARGCSRRMPTAFTTASMPRRRGSHQSAEGTAARSTAMRGTVRPLARQSRWIAHCAQHLVALAQQGLQRSPHR